MTSKEQVRKSKTAILQGLPAQKFNKTSMKEKNIYNKKERRNERKRRRNKRSCSPTFMEHSQSLLRLPWMINRQRKYPPFKYLIISFINFPFFSFSLFDVILLPYTFLTPLMFKETSWDQSEPFGVSFFIVFIRFRLPIAN